MTMLRFKPDQRLGFREYMRSDGTRSYFFSLDTVRGLFVGAGFTEVLIWIYMRTYILISFLASKIIESWISITWIYAQNLCFCVITCCNPAVSEFLGIERILLSL